MIEAIRDPTESLLHTLVSTRATFDRYLSKLLRMPNGPACELSERRLPKLPTLSFQPILKWPKDSESSDSLLSQPSGLEMYDGYIGMHGGFQNGEIRKIVPKTGFCNLEPPSRLPDALQKFGAFSGPSRSSPQRLGSSGCFISDIQPLEYCDNSKISEQKLKIHIL